MQKNNDKYYPTTFEAIHLLVLLIVLQSLVDFPLAMYDYQKDTNLLSNPWISFISGICIVTFIFIFGYKKAQNKITEVFALKPFNPLLLIPVIILLPGLQYIIGFLNIEVEKILPAPPWFWELFEKIFENRFGFWGVFFKVAILAPVIEEGLFRGIIMHGFMRNYKNWYAILISSLLFSIYHLNPWQMTYTFFLGLFLGLLMIRTRSLILCILAHSLNNIIVLLSITYSKEISESSISSFPMPGRIIISAFVILSGATLMWYFTQKTPKITK